MISTESKIYFREVEPGDLIFWESHRQSKLILEKNGTSQHRVIVFFDFYYNGRRTTTSSDNDFWMGAELFKGQE